MDVSATGPCGIVGSTYTRLTHPFALEDIKTHAPDGPMGVAAQLELSDLFSNCTARKPTETYTMPACATQAGGPANQIGGLVFSPSCSAQLASYNKKVSFENVHCYPLLYYPSTEIQELDPAWTTCIAPKYALVFDPPRTLAPAAAMVPTQTSSDHQSVAAAPAPIVGPLAPSQTPPPSQPGLAPGSGNDPGGNDAPSQDPAKIDPPSGKSQMHAAPASNAPASGPPSNNPLVNDPLANDPHSNKALASSSPSNRPPPIDPPARGSPANEPLGSDPPTHDPPSRNPSSNDPPIGNPLANVPPLNHAANEHNSPDSDPQNGFKPAQNPSEGRSQYPSPSFAVPIAGGQSLPGIIINPSTVVIAGSTIRPGASAVQIQNHQVSLDPGASIVAVDGHEHALFTTSPLPVAWGNNNAAPMEFPTAVYGDNIEAASKLGISVEGQSISGGANWATVANIPVPLHPTGALVLDTSTTQGVLSLLTTSSQPFTTAIEAVTIQSNGVAVAVNTPNPNVPAVLVAGTSASIMTNGVVMATTTATHPTPATPAIIMAVGTAVTRLANGNVIISGSTLIPDAPSITIGGIPVSLGSNSLVVGTSTIALPSSPSTSSVLIAGQMLPISLSPSVVAIAGTLIQSGQTAMTISGTPVSLGTSGLVIGSSTIPLSSTIPVDGVGGYIFSGFHGGMSVPSTTSPAAILGSGARLRWSALTIVMSIIISLNLL